MQKSRRDVVVGGLATAAVAIPALAAVSTTSTGTTSTSTTKTSAKTQTERSWWESMVGQPFYMRSETGTLTTTLAAVERIPFDPLRPQTLARTEPFVATFSAPLRNAPLGQKSYPVACAGKAIFDVFLSRGTDRATSTVLLAVFN